MRKKSVGGSASPFTTRGHAAQLSLLSFTLMRKLSTVPPSGPSPDQCEWCLANPEAESCPACVSRRERLESMLAQTNFDLASVAARIELNTGLDLPLTAEEPIILEAMAERMAISVQRVHVLLEQLVDHRAMRRLREEGNQIPNQRLRRLVISRLRADPTANLKAIAKRAGFGSGTDMGRHIGLYETQVTVRGDKRWGGVLKTTIDRGIAERILVALGYAPSELDRL